MAISVDSTTNLNIIDQAEATTGWTFSGITKTATNSSSREGTNCVGGQVALNTHGYAYHTHGTAINMTTAGNERVYIWVKCAGAGTAAQDGWKVVIGDGTNRRAYTVGGSDAEPFGAKGWYCLMLDTANLPTPYSGFGSGTPSLTAITEFGFGVYNTVAPSGNALNVFVDIVRYGSGLVVTSGATDDISLADLAADDFSSATGKAYGIIREIQPGVYGVQGDILFGDTAGSSIDWKETDAVVIFEDRVKGASTNTVFKMSGQHSATGTFSVELGTAVSSGDSESGRSGVSFISANPANQPINFDFSDSDIEDLFLYGCSFTNMQGGTIAFSSDATNGISHHLSGTSFSGCSQVAVGRTVVRNGTFAATSDIDAALLWNTNIDIKRSQFLGNTIGAAIEMLETVDQDYDALTFAGNTNDTLLNNGTPGTNIDISKSNGSNPTSYENAPSNTATITYVGAAVTLTVTVYDGSTSPPTLITDQTVNILIEAGATGPLTEGTDIIKAYSNASGQATDTRVWASNQSIKGWARRSSSGNTPLASGYNLFKTFPIAGTINTVSGANVTVLLQPDE